LELQIIPFHWDRVSIEGTGDGLLLPPFANLVRLELSHHVENGRPSLTQFIRLLSYSPTLVFAHSRIRPLSYSPTLETLVLRDSGPTSIVDEDTGGTSWIAEHQVSLRFLSSLTITCIDDDNHICSLLRLIKAPNLTALALEDLSGEDNRGDLSQTLSYLAGTWISSSETEDLSFKRASSPPFPSVETPRLVRIVARGSTTAFVTLLRVLERVTHHYLECEDLDLELIEGLPAEGDATLRPLVCPRLEELGCSHNIPGHKLQHFVERRLRAPLSQLRRIQIDRWDRRIVRKELSWLRDTVGDVNFFRHDDDDDGAAKGAELEGEENEEHEVPAV
jgi:hypothetical protein